jgi:hypothetical protein
VIGVTTVLFQVTHTHSSERCPGANAELTAPYGEWWQSMKATSGVEVLSGYVSPMDHVFHITVEADDYATLARALGPLNAIGEGQTSPVLTLDQAFPMAEKSAFRPRPSA